MKALADSKDRVAWKLARAGLVTASDVPKMLLCGYAKNEAERMQQRAVLRTLKAFGGEDVEETEQMVIGRYLETAVIEYQREEKGWVSLAHNTILYASDEQPLLGATPDAVYVDVDGVECDVDVKCTAGAAQEDCKDGSTAMFANGVPTHWCVQVTAQMAVSGRQRGYVLALHHADRHGMKVRAYRIDRYEPLVRRIMDDVPVFFAEVERLKAGEVT